MLHGHEVLGWGGYWAWDPVENVSFIPWLLSTAFLHSSKIQRNQNTLLNWNYILVGLMFLSTILEPLLQDQEFLFLYMHFKWKYWNLFTFGLLFFSMFFVFVGSKNSRYFQTSNPIENWFGKTGFFVFNNIVLFSIAVVVFIGTIFPLFYETLYNRQITIGRAYYDVLSGPLLLILIVLMIFSASLPIKNLNLNKWINQNSFLINLSLAFSIFILINFKNTYQLIATTVFSILLIVVMVLSIYKTLNKRKYSISFLTGQIAHLGIGILALGIIFNVTQSFSNEIEISSFEEFEFNNNVYFVYDIIEESKPEKNILKLPISNEEQTKYTSLNIYRNSSQQAISTPAVFRNPLNDIYITIKFIDEESYKLIVRNNYGILIMWIGLFISSISFIPRLIKNEE